MFWGPSSGVLEFFWGSLIESLVVTVLAFNSNSQSLNPADICSFWTLNMKIRNPTVFLLI